MKYLFLAMVTLVLFFSACSTQEIRETLDCGEITKNADCSNRGCLENSCFLEAVKDCHPAKIVITKEESRTEIITTSIVKTEIIGFEGDNCVVKNKILDHKINITDDHINRLINSNLPEDLIRRQIDSRTRLSESKIGLEGVCRYPHRILILKVNEKGYYPFSEDDGINFGCEGSAYST